MLRPVVVLSTVMIFVLAAGVFYIERRVENLRQDLIYLNSSILENKERIHVLKAEWSYLNQPMRLEQLASAHLPLEDMKVAQVKPVEYIPLRPIMVSQR